MRPTADVVIIGGGCMGASVAYHLARRGVTRIALLERESLLGAGSHGPERGRGAASVLDPGRHPALDRVDPGPRAFSR